jgi:hypothetical protein
MTKSKKTDWKDERPVYLWLAIAGVIIATAFYFIPKNSRDIDETKLAVINNLILDKDPEIVTSRRSGDRILLHIQGYEKPFQVAGFDFSESIKRKIIGNIKLGDTVNVKIDSSEFNKVDNETLIDSYIEINSLTKGGQEYLNIKQANHKAKSDLEFGVPAGLYLMIAGLIYWSFKTRPKFSPSIVIGGGLLLIILMSRY